MSLLLALTATSDPSGSLSAQESGSDIAAGSGAVLAAGSLASVETAIFDTFGSTSAALSQGQLAATEAGADATAMSASLLAQGVVLALETGVDTLSSIGAAPTTGAMSALETGYDVFTGTTPITPTEEVVSYYGTWRPSSYEPDILAKVLDKYNAISQAQAKDAEKQPAQPEIKPIAVDPLAKALAQARRQRIIDEVRARAVATAKATAKAEADAKAVLERASRQAIEMPFATAAKAASSQRTDDDQIMALVAMMMLED